MPLSKKEERRLVREMQERAVELREAYRRSRIFFESDPTSDGWNRPPALIPHPAELALGICYDPTRNTR